MDDDVGAFTNDDSAVLTGASAFEESSEHAAKQAMKLAIAILVTARFFLNSRNITKPSFILNYFASGSSGWMRAITPTVARVALTKSAGATFSWSPRSPALT